ncbi:MAG TPA: trigger factor [Mycobacteriales bacterium]
MKSTVESLSPTRVRLAVEVPFDELKPSLDRAYKQIAGQVRVPGFRPGKAPAAIIDRRVGRGTVLNEAVQDAVPRYYADAIQETGAKVIGQPDIEVTKIDDGDVLAFTAEVDVRPDLTLPDLAGLSATVDEVDVADSDIDEQISALRDRFAVLQGVDRPVQSGDYVSIDLSASVDGEPLPDAASTGMSYEVGSGELMEGLDDALSGMSAGETKEFTTELVGGDYAGRTADVSVTPRSVKEKELPELDDDFAQTASEFETLAELTEDIRTRLQRVKQAQQGSDARDKVLDALLAATDVPLPDSVVETELNWRQENIDRQLAEAGMSREDYLKAQEQSEADIDAEMRSSAEQAVKTQLVLDALADAEQIGVSDQDLTEHIVAEAQRYGVAPQQLAQQVQQSGNLASLVADVRRNKAMRHALAAATVTDSAGNPVDLTPLLGPDEDDEAADGTADPTVPDEQTGEQAQADAEGPAAEAEQHSDDASESEAEQRS